MKCVRKTFLIMVGAISIAFDEVSKAIEEAAQSIDDQRKKQKKPFIELQKQSDYKE